MKPIRNDNNNASSVTYDLEVMNKLVKHLAAVKLNAEFAQTAQRRYQLENELWPYILSFFDNSNSNAEAVTKTCHSLNNLNIPEPSKQAQFIYQTIMPLAEERDQNPAINSTFQPEPYIIDYVTNIMLDGKNLRYDSDANEALTRSIRIFFHQSNNHADAIGKILNAFTTDANAFIEFQGKEREAVIESLSRAQQTFATREFRETIFKLFNVPEKSEQNSVLGKFFDRDTKARNFLKSCFNDSTYNQEAISKIIAELNKPSNVFKYNHEQCEKMIGKITPYLNNAKNIDALKSPTPGKF